MPNPNTDQWLSAASRIKTDDTPTRRTTVLANLDEVRKSVKIWQQSWYPKVFLGLAVFCLLLTYGVVIANGIPYFGLNISDRVIMTMLISTLVNFLSPVLIFAKYLFKNGN